MNLDLTDEEAAALLRELNGLIDGDRYEGDPRQDQAGAGARAVASAAEAICATAGDRGTETARKALSRENHAVSLCSGEF
jgi:hypothetical protein